MSIIEEMNADILRENEKRWEKSKGLLVGESAAVFFAGQVNPYRKVSDCLRAEKKAKK
jgi:hypothetical protein